MQAYGFARAFDAELGAAARDAHVHRRLDLPQVRVQRPAQVREAAVVGFGDAVAADQDETAGGVPGVSAERRRGADHRSAAAGRGIGADGGPTAWQKRRAGLQEWSVDEARTPPPTGR
ncbi:MAG: hypothetical protein U1F25_01760 [Rubrivivax sp.]